MILYLVEIECPHRGFIEVDVIKEDDCNYFVEFGFFHKSRFKAHKTKQEALYYCVISLQSKASYMKAQAYNMWSEYKELDIEDAQKAKKGEKK